MNVGGEFLQNAFFRPSCTRPVSSMKRPEKDSDVDSLAVDLEHTLQRGNQGMFLSQLTHHAR